MAWHQVSFRVKIEDRVAVFAWFARLLHNEACFPRNTCIDVLEHLGYNAYHINDVIAVPDERIYIQPTIIPYGGLNLCFYSLPLAVFENSKVEVIAVQRASGQQLMTVLHLHEESDDEGDMMEESELEEGELVDESDESDGEESTSIVLNAVA